MESLGRFIILFGFLLVAVGGIFLLLGRIGVPSLPGDISLRRGNVDIYIPIGTSILLSILLTIVANLLVRR